MSYKYKLQENEEIKALLNKVCSRGFFDGMGSVFSISPKTSSLLRDNFYAELNATIEKISPRYAKHKLLYHHVEPSIENYWKNVGSYIRIAVDDFQENLDEEQDERQPKML